MKQNSFSIHPDNVETVGRFLLNLDKFTKIVFEDVPISSVRVWKSKNGKLTFRIIGNKEGAIYSTSIRLVAKP